MLKTIADSLSIDAYQRESKESFTYRVCYSALGLWLLKLAESENNGKIGISKILQTIKIAELFNAYRKSVGLDESFFTDKGKDIAIFIRNVYEETGYLFSDSRYSVLANYGRTIRAGDTYLYFGIPQTFVEMNGLGVYSSRRDTESNYFETFTRDQLNVAEFIEGQYNLENFEIQNSNDVNASNYEFFNPLLSLPPSQSWSHFIKTEYTVARILSLGVFYKVVYKNNECWFSLLNINDDATRLYSYELRRLYCELKKYYNNPAKMWINKIDDNYSEIRLSANLPNREYYFLLLTTWPKGNLSDRRNFIARNDKIKIIKEVLSNIGVSAE
jgi:hypothetical protein